MEDSRRRFRFGWLGGGGAVWSRLKEDVLGWFERNGTVLAGVAVGLLILALIAPGLRRWWTGREHALRLERGDAVASDATLMYQKALEMLKSKGVEKPAWVTPAEFVRHVPGPETAAVVSRLTDAYNDLRFGGRGEAASRMVILLGELEQRLKTS